MTKTMVVGVGEFAVSNDPEEVIKTFGLGSCVAVVFLHQPSRSVGMLHVALPESTCNPDIARRQPGYFVDTGIPAILREMAARSRAGNGLARGMVVKMAGGANVMDSSNTFDIGKRNVLALKKLLWSLGMGPVAEDVGGSISRTVATSARHGRVLLSCATRGEREL